MLQRIRPESPERGAEIVAWRDERARLESALFNLEKEMVELNSGK
jgi:hypothetical protein